MAAALQKMRAMALQTKQGRDAALNVLEGASLKLEDIASNTVRFPDGGLELCLRRLTILVFGIYEFAIGSVD